MVGSTADKALATGLALLFFPVALAVELTKKYDPPKRRRRRRGI
jgi:hypothetical protein